MIASCVKYSIDVLRCPQLCVAVRSVSHVSVSDEISRCVHVKSRMNFLPMPTQFCETKWDCSSESITGHIKLGLLAD
jgi:hypothetical protein